MTTVPPGYSTLGPVYLLSTIKEKFKDCCKLEDVTMESELKRFVKMKIKEKFPEFECPVDERELDG
jgi:hypothetical protein